MNRNICLFSQRRWGDSKQCQRARSYHRTPKNEDVRKKWMQFILEKLPAFKYHCTEYYMLCSLHFEDSCFSNKRMVENDLAPVFELLSDAVPTIYHVDIKRQCVHESHDIVKRRKFETPCSHDNAQKQELSDVTAASPGSMTIPDVEDAVKHRMFTLAKELDMTVAKLLTVLLDVYHKQHELSSSSSVEATHRNDHFSPSTTSRAASQQTDHFSPARASTEASQQSEDLFSCSSSSAEASQQKDCSTVRCNVEAEPMEVEVGVPSSRDLQQTVDPDLLLADLRTNSSEIQQRTITRTRHKRNTDIVNTAQVKSTSQIVTSHTKQLHEEDAEQSNKSAPQRMMCVSDRKLLAAYFKRARNDPQVLLEAVWFILFYHFGARSPESWTRILKTTFVLRQEGRDLEYVMLNDQAVGVSNDQRLYGVVVELYKRFLNHLHPDQNRLFQHPAKTRQHNNIWYDKQPCGKDYFAKMMTVISKSAKLSQVYTQHVISDCCITELFGT